MNIGALYVNEDVISYITFIIPYDKRDSLLLLNTTVYRILLQNKKYIRYREVCSSLVDISRKFICQDEMLRLKIYIDHKDSTIIHQDLREYFKSKSPLWTYFPVRSSETGLLIRPKNIVKIIRKVNKFNRSNEILNMELSPIYEDAAFLEYNISSNVIC